MPSGARTHETVCPHPGLLDRRRQLARALVDSDSGYRPFEILTIMATPFDPATSGPGPSPFGRTAATPSVSWRACRKDSPQASSRAAERSASSGTANSTRKIVFSTAFCQYPDSTE